METTGLGVHHDLPVQIALVWTVAGSVVRSDSFLVDPRCEIPEDVVAIHGITTARARSEGCRLEEAAARVHSAMRRAFAEGVPVVAMNASFDVTIAEELFASCGLPRLRWEILIDPLVLDRHVDPGRDGRRSLEALCDHYRVKFQNPHEAAADALAAVVLARKIGAYYRECGEREALELTALQAAWHHEWAVAHDAWLRESALGTLDPEEFSWPYRERPSPDSFLAGAAVLLGPI